MQPERAERVAQIVGNAAELEGEERRDFIARACADDRSLQSEVESLLQFQESPADLLDTSVAELGASLLAASNHDLAPGSLLGGYKILSLIGEGGMGQVYLAEDVKLGRQIAIKLGKAGLPGASLRHFQNEERILAALNHPNIARLYGAGITPDGLPFFVMEYIEGVRIDDYCREKQLSLTARLNIFRKVCGAVTYAHQRLIIHRDLKPANIRVTPEGEPKLLDFGIATLLDPAARSSSEQTITLQTLMTPDFASPEQARGEMMTTASDVYSLGIVLYELLTGQRPFRTGNLRLDEIVQAIAEEEPTRPSIAAARVADKIADESDTNPVRPRVLRGDLDNIILRAIRKEPDRRYPSAAQFSDDIRRYLEGLPVIARKDSAIYRGAKFVRRNRVAVAAVTLVLFALVTALFVSLWEARRAKRERDVVTRINGFLHRMLSFSNQSVTSVSPVAQRKDITVNEMLDEITPQITTEFADQPSVRAQVLRTVGSTYASQGRYEAAEKNLRAALATQTALFGTDNPEAAATMRELGILCYRREKFAEAADLLEKAVAFFRKREQARTNEQNAANLGQALDHLGVVKFFQGDAPAALSLLNEALRVTADRHESIRSRAIRASIETDLGGGLVLSGRLDEGEPLLRESLSEYRKIFSRPQWEMGATLEMLGELARRRNRPDEAETFLRESEQVYRETLGESNAYFIRNLDEQSAVLFLKKEWKAAEEKARAALDLCRRYFPETERTQMSPLLRLSDIYVATGRAAEAEQSLRAVLAIVEKPGEKDFDEIVLLKVQLSQFLFAQGRHRDAEELAFSAKSEAAEHLPTESSTAKAAVSNFDKIEFARKEEGTNANLR